MTDDNPPTMQIDSLRHFLAAVSQHGASQQADDYAVVQRFVQRLISTASTARLPASNGQPLVHAVLAEIHRAQQLQQYVDLPAVILVGQVNSPAQQPAITADCFLCATTV